MIEASAGGCLSASRRSGRIGAGPTRGRSTATPGTARLRRGVGVGCMWYGCGNTSLSNPSTMRIGIGREGRLTLYNGAVDIGQGSNTVMIQICADALGVPAGRFEVIMGDTALTADAGKIVGLAADLRLGQGGGARRRRICAPQLLRRANAGDDAVIEIGDGEILVYDGGAPRRLDLRTIAPDDRGDVLVGEGSFDPPTTPLDGDGQGVPYATYAFGAQMAEVEVDLDLGTVKVRRIVAAHDVGKAINPTLVEGQIHGGIAQGIGLALMEEFMPGRTENLHDYLIPTFGDVPPIETILIEDAEPLGPFGAKGIGEPALIPDGAGDPRRRVSRDRASGSAFSRRRRTGCARRSWPRAAPEATAMAEHAETRSEGIVTCDACPVLCRIRPGRSGACDRYGNVGGVLTRLDPFVVTQKVAEKDGKVVPFGQHAWEGSLVSGAPVFVTGIGSGTTYPDYKPAPFIVSSLYDGVDMVTVVSEDLQLLRPQGEDRYRPLHRPGNRGGARRGRAGGPRHHGGVRLADALARGRPASDRRLQAGGQRHLRHDAQAVRRRRDRPDGGGRRADDDPGRGAARDQWQSGRAHAGRLRLGRDRHLRQAVVRRSRRGDRGRRPHPRRPDQHQAGQVPQHEARGIRVRGRKSTPGAISRWRSPDRLGGTDIVDPLAIIEKIDLQKAWPGLRLLMVSTTGEDAAFFLLDDKLERCRPRCPHVFSRSWTASARLREPALCTIMFMAGPAAACARGSPRTRSG